MARQKLDKGTRKSLLDARRMIEDVAKADGNEAETRSRVERIFESVLGYDVFKHITREFAVHGVGNTVHCDFAIQLDREESSGPDILVELKKVGVDLAPKHLRQAASYAIDKGCEWALLTNGKEWKLYHILFDKPPQRKLIASWNLIEDDPTVLAERFDLISYKNIRKGSLAQLWAKSNVLTAHNLLNAVLSEESLALIRRRLKRATDVTVSPEEIVGAVRHLLNEAAISEMGKIKISLPEKKPRKKTTTLKSLKSKKAKEDITVQAMQIVEKSAPHAS